MPRNRDALRAVFTAVALGGGAVAVSACAKVDVREPTEIETAVGHAEVWGSVWSVATFALLVLSILMASAGVVRMLRASSVKPKIFARGIVLLLGAIASLAFAGMTAVPAGMWEDAEAVTRQDWFRNNFELPLIALGVAVVALLDCIARAWARTANRSSAVRTATVSSIIAGCAVGVSILVAIGSSAFSASLWQREIKALVKSDEGISLERIQFTVDRLGALDDSTAALSSRIEEYREDSRRFRTRAAGALARARRMRDEADLLRGRPNLGERVASLDRGASLATLDANESQKLADSYEQRADDVAGDRRGAELRHACRIFEFARMIEAAEDGVVALTPAGAQMTVATQRVPAPTEELPAAEGAARSCFANQTVAPSAFVRARTILETAQPIRRSWMSAQLAKRAPILLSIELVLLMGALGALLREASRALRPDDLADEVGAVGAGAPRDATKQPNELVPDFETRDGALLMLGLSVVRGTSTALVFFVLMQATMTTVLIDAPDGVAESNEINPFTVALLGLAGGYAAGEVLAWLGNVVSKSRGNEGNANRRRSPPPPPPGPASPPTPP